MEHPFETASGTVIGHKHAADGVNNQDSSLVARTSAALIAVVCDGCTSGHGGSSHNDVGAQLGARITTSAIIDSMMWHGRLDWVDVRNRVADDLRRAMSLLRVTEPDHVVVADYLLFTTVAIVITNEVAEVAALGDGVVFINGNRLAMRPVVGGAPAYVAYNLTSKTMTPEQLRYDVIATMPTSELATFLIGSDGCDDLIAAEHKCIPGQSAIVGPIDRFWTDDAYFKNSDAVRRKLVITNGGVWRPTQVAGGVWHQQGYLSDDTTLVTGRRKVAAAMANAVSKVTGDV